MTARAECEDGLDGRVVAAIDAGGPVIDQGPAFVARGGTGVIPGKGLAVIDLEFQPVGENAGGVVRIDLDRVDRRIIGDLPDIVAAGIEVQRAGVTAIADPERAIGLKRQEGEWCYGGYGVSFSRPEIREPEFAVGNRRVCGISTSRSVGPETAASAGVCLDLLAGSPVGDQDDVVVIRIYRDRQRTAETRNRGDRCVGGPERGGGEALNRRPRGHPQISVGSEPHLARRGDADRPDGGAGRFIEQVDDIQAAMRHGEDIAGALYGQACRHMRRDECGIDHRSDGDLLRDINAIRVDGSRRGVHLRPAGEGGDRVIADIPRYNER